MDGMSKFLVSEVQLLMNINCPTVIKLYFYYEDSERIYLIIELANDGNLLTLLRKQDKLTENEVLNVS